MSVAGSEDTRDAGFNNESEVEEKRRKRREYMRQYRKREQDDQR
ncbi:hypothetical protein PC129_g22624 [Phytophthora cactorum]|uniref:Uncharacterized protein n=1 Tax=Phytophthora cactorum TaxID=29920 RepID=A0A329RCJ5_9STRA|nr:hypothetical protein Pcac1_g25328 [Phytophthora cactorum]KAG2795388.1 hypothetical protein PC112_g22660 [Phytophthora cactorum]KAG2796555.1 hypothetical protein PC111_g21673 [Phytophthora cactorum]KAG2876684.1 hypothetical protein PC114_g24072 [Phytophthora cactorum]KAG2891360.1 hypothetical protein PC117_g24262 [Phytophthora cactorum]